MEQVDEKVKIALDQARDHFPVKPIVEGLEAFPYVDTIGNDALEIFVIISDATQDEEINGQSVMQIKSSIRQSLQKNGIFLFPYTHFSTRSHFESRHEVE